MYFRRVLSAVLPVIFAASAMGGTESRKNTVVPIQDPLSKGVNEIEVLGGYFHSPVTTGGGQRPQFDYAGSDIRLGIVLTPMLLEQTFLRGNVEFLGDIMGDGVLKGAGNYLVG